MVAIQNPVRTTPEPLGRRRVRRLTVDAAARTTVLATGSGSVRVSAVPDPAAGRRATVGMRRLHHLLIDVSGATASCTVAGLTRRLVRRRLPLAAALALAAQGVPAFVTAAEEG